jgi:C4-dicarboxylate-binding protein DctP
MAMEAIRAAGKTEVYTLSAQEQAEWRRALAPVQKEMEEYIGKELIRAINLESAMEGAMESAK